MTTRATAKGKNKKPLETTLGKAPVSPSDDPIDLSHIRKPLDTSIFGLRQVLQLFETGTDEVRRYVAYECDVMYECRMCRTIFRSLANFILHKRNYCRESYNRNDHTNCRNNCQEKELYVIQEDTDLPLVVPNEQESGTSSPVSSKQAHSATNSDIAPSSKKNLSAVLRRLQGRQESSLITEQCLSEDVSNESRSSEKDEAKNNVSLENIDGSSSGVFQSMFRNMINEYKADLMKTEVMEIHNILENNEAILGSDGKIIATEIEKSSNFVCVICNQKFSTRKTLAYHIKYKHNNTRLLYQCPECSDTFANTWSVFRHLYKIHRKTMAQVKKMRSQIHDNIIRRDEKPEVILGANATTESTSNLQKTENLENQWMDDLESDNDLQRCGGCGRKFERKAALHSHSQFCSKRIAVCNSIKENSAKRVHLEEKQLDKSKQSTKTTSALPVEIAVKGSRRRKQLISQKMCRVDYVKDEEKVENKKLEDGTADKLGDKVYQDLNNPVINEKIINKDEEVVVIQDSIEFEEDKLEVQKSLVGETCPVSRAEWQSCDIEDVVYVNTLQLPPSTEEIKNLMEAQTDVYNNLSDILDPISKNIIITRSKTTAISNFAEDNSSDKTDQEHREDISTDIEKPIIEPFIPFKTVESFATLQNNSLMPESTDTKEDIEILDGSKRKRMGQSPDSLLEIAKRKKDQPILETASVSINDRVKAPNITLEVKSLKYINKQKHICLPCEKAFKSHKSLMKHMAIHFNWYRYQCRSCSFMSYSRSKCDRHVEEEHTIPEEMLKNSILHIPSWKTVDQSTDFIKRSRKYKTDLDMDEDKSLMQTTSEEDIVHEEECKPERKGTESPGASSSIEKPFDCETTEENSNGSLPKPDVQDPSVRKMIMQVIFGNQDEPDEVIDPTAVVANQENKPFSVILEQKSEVKTETETGEFLGFQNNPKKEDLTKPTETGEFLGFENSPEKEDSTKPLNSLRENPRPVRHRVPTVQKDFLYDMGQILKSKGKDKETHLVGSTDCLKKPKPLKTYVKDTSKPKRAAQLTVANSKKVLHKSDQSVVPEPPANSVQDINMNSKPVVKTCVTED